MKCKFCGHDISDTDTKCPGCDKDVETLKNEGNVIYSETTVDSDIMVGEASTLKDNLTEAEESVDTPVVETVEEVKPEEVTNTTEEKVEPVVIKDKFKKKSGFKGFIICLLIILLLAAGGFSYMYFVYTNPVKVTKKMYSDLLNVLPTTKGTSVEVECTTSRLDGYTINAKNYVSNTDIISNIKVSGNDAVIEVSGVKSGSDIYFYQSDVYDKYIKVNEENLLFTDSLKMLNVILHRNDIINIIKTINFENYISSNELSKEFTTVTHDQKNMGATKFSYSNNKANGVISKLLIAIRDNSANLESVAKILNMTREDALNKINELITEVNNNTYKIGFDLYTDYLTKSYYKLDINVKNNEHSLVINIEFNDNKVKEVKVTYDETYIYVTNNMETITINSNDYNATYNYKFGNEVLEYPVLDEAVLYNDVSITIDENISKNEGIKKLFDTINGNIVDDVIEDPLITPLDPLNTPDVVNDPIVPDLPNNINE